MSFAAGAGLSEWIVDGLCPCTGVGSHDRCDDIDKLCETGNFDTVCMTKQSNQDAAD